jgi:hypothetical protein
MNQHGKLVLWLAGSGIDEAKTQAILADEKVQHVLSNAPDDKVWLIEALNDAGCKLGVRPVDLANPREMLQFMALL